MSVLSENGHFLCTARRSLSPCDELYHQHDRAEEHARDRPDEPAVFRLSVAHGAEGVEEVNGGDEQPVDAADRADDGAFRLCSRGCSPPPRKLVLEQEVGRTPNRRLICTTLSISGTDCAPSHLLTDWRVTPSCSASSSCDQPAFLRRAVILSANIIREVLRFRRARCLFDGQSIPLFAVADKKDGQEICQSTVARRAENGSARSFFRNGSPWASICGTYSKGERRCW